MEALTSKLDCMDFFSAKRLACIVSVNQLVFMRFDAGLKSYEGKKHYTQILHGAES
jgi:hypothetical protein